MFCDNGDHWFSVHSDPLVYNDVAIRNCRHIVTPQNEKPIRGRPMDVSISCIPPDSAFTEYNV